MFIFQSEETFSPTIFFIVILPPIIFESGYNLHKVRQYIVFNMILVFCEICKFTGI